MIRFFLWLILLIAVAAPFTFLKPSNFDNVAEQKLDVNDKNRALTIKKPNEIVKAPKVIEKPLHDVALPDFAAIRDIPTKKATFFNFIKPSIIAENNRILTIRTKLDSWLENSTLGLGLTVQEEMELAHLATKYRIKKTGSSLQLLTELLIRVDIIPLSLVLVQAANESAWGTSRFAKVGLNFFGIWCYRPHCGMVPKGRNAGAKHEVAAFTSIDEAVSGYFKNINSHNAYHVFRTIRSQLRGNNQPFSSEILATGLLPYSERGADYVMDITDMLRHNQVFFADEKQEDYYKVLIE